MPEVAATRKRLDFEHSAARLSAVPSFATHPSPAQAALVGQSSPAHEDFYARRLGSRDHRDFLLQGRASPDHTAFRENAGRSRMRLKRENKGLL
jgi:hypothetical protein